MPYLDLTDCTASELASLIRDKQLSPVEVTAHFLERISRYNDELRAFITTAPEHAMAEAHRAEAAVIAGDALGPFHGVPIGIKDLSDTKGIRTTYGSLLFGENVPTHDNIAVERIRASGAIIAGKTNTPDFGWKGTTESTIIGACANPWDTSRTSGGSSGGAAAALAARLLPLCDGSDAGGSIRIPSSFCGTYGIKPTMGRVPAGYTRPGWGMLSQNGPLATNVRDAAMMLNVLAGPDQRDARALPSAPPDFTAALEHPTVVGLRIAWSPTMDEQPVDAEVRSLTQAAAGVFETLGADVEEDAPLISTEDAIWAFSTMMLTDMALTLGPAIEAGQGDFLPAQLLKWLTQAMTWPATRYSQALHLREWHRQRFDDLFEQYDLLAMPTMATPAFPIERNPKTIDGRDVHPAWGFTPFCLHANLTGRPAASIPCGFTEGGLPVGLMLIGRMGDEETILRASAAFEAAQPWSHKRPPRFP